MSEERFEEALDSFVAAVSQRPADLELLLAVARSLAKLTLFERALAAYEEVLRFDARETSALVGRAEALSALRRDALALAAWDEAIAVLDVRQVEHEGRLRRDLTDDYRARLAREARGVVLQRISA